MIVLKPPMPLDVHKNARAIFLAGSIEQGRAVDWQNEITRALASHDVTILNPRRDAWDATWKQSIEFPAFREQVEWELDGLERADLIAMWFAPNTQAPITLLELGLFARGGKIVVGCAPDYWRRGNVEVVCARFGLSLVAEWNAFVEAVLARVK